MYYYTRGKNRDRFCIFSCGRVHAALHVMANLRGARRTSLGVLNLSGRLRGGFTASSLSVSSPRPRPRLLDSPNATTYPSPSPAPSEDQHDSDPANLMGSTSGDVFAHLASLSSTLLAVREAVKGMDRRVASVEEAQLKVTDSVKELCALLKAQEKANFTIKGSIWEVKNNEIY